MPGPSGSPFHEKVYEVLRRVPAGRVTTYGDLARAVGKPGAARAVGTAMRLNPHPGRHTPCHRVVLADGSVGAYMGSLGGSAKKVSLLREEGVLVADGRVKDFARVRWTVRRGV